MRATGLGEGVMVYSTLSGPEFAVRQQVLPLMGVDARLPMASLTKPLVARQVYRHVQAGDMRLDQPVIQLLPDFDKTGGPEVTVRHLLQHQAGFDRAMRDPLFHPGPISCRRAAHDVMLRPAESSAGSRIIYSNAGYCVLGEVLLQQGWAGSIAPVLRTPLGAAGGWRGSVRQLNHLLRQQLPLPALDSGPRLPDGSYYAYGWRYWPQRSGLRWTHFGRLPGMVSVAASDGQQSMLVAHFAGDPPDYEAMALTYLDNVQRCLAAEVAVR